MSFRSTAQPLYTRFPIIFSSCFSKVTIGYHPRIRGPSATLAGAQEIFAARMHDASDCQSAPRETQVTPGRHPPRPRAGTRKSSSSCGGTPAPWTATATRAPLAAGGAAIVARTLFIFGMAHHCGLYRACENERAWPGTVIFWHHRTAHMAGQNHSRLIRQAVLYDCPPGARPAARPRRRVISDCHFPVQLNHFIPVFLSYSAAVFLN